MNLSLALGIIGTLVSLAFGAWGVSLAIRRRYAGEVTFVREQTIALFDAIVKNLPEVAVLYEQAPVSPNVVLVKGSFVNTGRKDISPAMTEKPISLCLASGCKWLNASVVSASPDVVANLELVGTNSVVVRSGLLRCKEFIRFQALAELNSTTAPPDRTRGFSTEARLEESLKFEHRIEDTRPIRTVELQETRYLLKRLRFYLLFPAFGLAFTLGFVLVSLFSGLPVAFAYPLKSTENRIVQVIATPRAGGMVRVRSLDRSYRATITLAEFASRCIDRPVIVEDNFLLVELVIGFLVFYVLLPSLFLALRSREYFANRRLRRLLEHEETDCPHAAT